MFATPQNKAAKPTTFLAKKKKKNGPTGCFCLSLRFLSVKPERPDLTRGSGNIMGRMLADVGSERPGGRRKSREGDL